MQRSLTLIILHLYVCRGITIPVRILAEEHVNFVSEKFLSFSVDPKYLFQKDHDGRECLCMASSLTPSIIRIAGPSTSLVGFSNSSITLNSSAEGVIIDTIEWKRFAEWARSNNVTVVFALNNAVKTKAGLWDPHTALDILTAAQQANLKDIVWQLGYECKNSSIEEYLKDLETLKVMVDTLPAMRWKVIAGDVSGCLELDSKADFSDYIRISTEKMDALFLDGNSTSIELNKLPAPQHQAILDTVSGSGLPLWITERSDSATGIERAAEWLAHLGYSARGGFDVNFRELTEDEIFKPTAVSSDFKYC